MKVARFFAAVGVDMRRAQDDDGSAIALGQTVGLVLKVKPARKSSEVRGTNLFFLVDNLEATFRAAVAAEGKAIQAPQVGMGGRRAVVADPEGRRVVLLQRSHTSAKTEDDDEPELDNVAAVADADERRALRYHRNGLALIVIGTLSIPVGMMLYSQLIEQDKRQLMLQPLISSKSYIVFLELVAIALVIAGKAFCLFGRGRIAAVGWIAAAVIIDVAVIVAPITLPKGAVNHPLLFAILVVSIVLSPTALAGYLAEVARHFKDRQLETSAGRVVKAGLLTVVLLIIALLLTALMGGKPAEGLAMIVGFFYIALTIVGVVGFALYLLMLGQFVVFAHQSLQPVQDS